MKLYVVAYRSKKFDHIMGLVFEKESSAKAFAEHYRSRAVSEPITIEIPLKGVDL